MSDRYIPKVLLVEGDEREQARMKFAAHGTIDLRVEDNPMTAINRLGLEDFDVVLVDPDVSSLPVTEKFLEALQRLRARVMVLQNENGNSKRLSDSARFRAAMLPRSNFVQSVLADLTARPPRRLAV